MDGVEFVNGVADLLTEYAKKHNFNKQIGYEILIKQTNYKFERLLDTIWISNPNGINPAEQFTRKIELLNLKDAKKSTLNSKVNFLENFLMECKRHQTEIAILPFEATRKQKKQKEYTTLIDSIKSVF